ncbi:MAG: Type 1 glutamine amidotransferase-like domain-containing protein [Bacilli bacterium]
MTNILLSRSHFSQFKEDLERIILPKHRVVVLAFSFFSKHLRTKEEYESFYHPGQEYRQKINNEFAAYGIKDEQIFWISYYSTTKDEAIKQIKQADILYFPGGAPDQMMDRIEEWDLTEVLEKHRKIYMGSSAGAMIQLETYHISPDQDYKTFRLEKGLNLINDFFIEVHYSKRKKQKKAMRKMRKAYYKPIYSIPDDGCLIVFDGVIRPIHPARQIYTKTGVVKV